jgi:hypothetical protein
MSSESVCQVARSWVDVGSFHTRIFGVLYYAVASVREFLDTPSYLIQLVVFVRIIKSNKIDHIKSKFNQITESARIYSCIRNVEALLDMQCWMLCISY